MPQISERQVLLDVLDDAISALRKSWRSLIVYLLIQGLIFRMIEVYSPETGDDWDAIATAPLYVMVSDRLLLIHRLQRLREYTITHRYYEDRHNWRGLREDRDAVMDRILGQNDDWLRRMVRVNRRSFDYILSRVRDHVVFHNRSRNQQLPVRWQLLVALCRFGHDGNSIAVRMVASMFSISEGTVFNWTRRVILALLSLESVVIRWPDAEERNRIKTRIGRRSAFGHCVGFADGSLLPLATRPALQDDYVFFSRKHGYSVNTLFVCDDTCRITFMSIGWAGSTHDSRVYKSTDLHIYPHVYFSPEQYLLADSGYQGVDEEFLVAGYKSNIATEVPWAERQRFNAEVARMRVKAEHMFGMLKMRWHSLKSLRALVQNDNTFEQMVFWIRGCAILHNLLLGQPDDTFSEGVDMIDLQNRWEHEAEETRLADQPEEDVGRGRGRVRGRGRGRGRQREGLADGNRAQGPAERGRGRGRGMVPDSGQRQRLRQHFTRSGYVHAYN